MIVFRDLHGREHRRPDDVPVEWRVSCYTVALRDGKLLVTEPVWSHKHELPGGRVDVGTEESIVAAAARECLEETGYVFEARAETLQLATENFFCFPQFRRYYHALAFVVQGDVTNDAPLSEPDPVEIAHVAWVDPSLLTEETAQWMHLAALRRLGIVP